MKKVGSLTSEQSNILHFICCSPHGRNIKPFARDRAKIISMSSCGKTSSAVATELGFDRKTVSHVIDAWQAHGLAALGLENRGRKKKIDGNACVMTTSDLEGAQFTLRFCDLNLQQLDFCFELMKSKSSTQDDQGIQKKIAHAKQVRLGSMSLLCSAVNFFASTLLEAEFLLCDSIPGQDQLLREGFRNLKVSKLKPFRSIQNYSVYCHKEKGFCNVNQLKAKCKESVETAVSLIQNLNAPKNKDLKRLVQEFLRLYPTENYLHVTNTKRVIAYCLEGKLRNLGREPNDPVMTEHIPGLCHWALTRLWQEVPIRLTWQNLRLEFSD
ncbi:helix-turn-helix domain-containing protein [Halomicronema sp. CCY15110]|uniref:helix-turn-helix domain-containing protein n=1 Tax=Halomicronema sp. CCY15110 TaxID=2767773 RepID=UPI00194EA5CB|nr:helix-turn-helix domain-containing protein [Halomicronema sp. CCY15110]